MPGLIPFSFYLLQVNKMLKKKTPQHPIARRLMVLFGEKYISCLPIKCMTSSIKLNEKIRRSFVLFGHTVHKMVRNGNKKLSAVFFLWLDMEYLTYLPLKVLFFFLFFLSKYFNKKSFSPEFSE